MTPHPIIQKAAEGTLPAWARVTDGRRAHMERVAGLLASWAGTLGLDPDERTKWVALGYLHDALRNAADEELRGIVPAAMDSLPTPLLHGPAAAERLRADGVQDEAFLRAVAYHTLGHPELDRCGRALYAADFLEPGRDLLNDWRAQLRARLPAELDAVVREVLGARIAHLVDIGSPMRSETVAFWNALVTGTSG